MPGTLFVVATPIGNLEDMTLRGIRTLREVDLIAAEDTRRTAKLLAHYQIHRPMVSLHAHNEYREAQKLIARMLSGTAIALVSDAGTPGISDPGSHLVHLAHEAGILVTPIPGASSVTAALSASGFPASEFAFMGFPPRSGKERSDWMRRLAAERRTVVFFEAPHRLRKTLAEVTILAKRQIQLHREITKMHETLTISPNDAYVEDVAAKGEFVAIVGPADEAESGTDADLASIDFAVSIVGCMTTNADFELEMAVATAAKASDLEESVVRKAWKKHRIEAKRREAGLP